MGWVLFAVTLPWAITVGWGWVTLMAIVGAAEEVRLEEHGVLTATWRPWAASLWRFSTTIGRGIVFQAACRRKFTFENMGRIELHERVHVRQVEDLMLLSLIVGVVVFASTGNWLLGLALWWSGGAWQLPNFLTAAMRHGIGQAYRRSEHELSAYSQTDA